MKFEVITIFPKIFDSYFSESLIKKALDKGLIKIKVHNLRKWAIDRHKTVDDRPYSGGLGMVMKVEPIYKAIQSLKPKVKNPASAKATAGKAKVILFTPRGKQFNQNIAHRFSKLDQLIMICGRYEGVDERVAKYLADELISIGDYDLMGGELPAMIVIETISRLIPGVLGKPQLLKERITKKGGFLEYAQYTRPESFRADRDKIWRVPKVLLSGNHKKIEEWRNKHSKVIEK
jgi:tRNA (guanine37-N1)-methyltransferase